jgi:TPR repeat protein
VTLPKSVIQILPEASTRYSSLWGLDAWRKKDYPEAAKQWSRAVLSGDVEVMNKLAFLYFNGLGMKPRVSDAIRLWRVAAFAGDSEVQWHLGAAYEELLVHSPA